MHILLSREGAQDGQVIGIDADGCVIQEHERGEPYNSGESLLEFGNIANDPGDVLGNLTEREAKALLAALYARIWPTPHQPAPLAAKLREAIDAWPQFDDHSGAPSAEVNGGDLVEWFGGWRWEARALLGEG